MARYLDLLGCRTVNQYDAFVDKGHSSTNASYWLAMPQASQIP